MRIRDSSNDYYFAQALSYISVGIFLLSYAPDVEAKYLILTTGILSSSFSLVIVFSLILNVFHRFPLVINFIRTIDGYFKPLIISLSFLMLPLTVIATHEEGYFVLRLMFVIGWMFVAIVYMYLDYFRNIGTLFNIGSDTRGKIYKLFASISFMSSLLGLILVVIRVIDPDSAQFMLSLNKWLYYPMVWFAVAAICLIPIVIIIIIDNEYGE